jgi:hypothetical protein
MAHLFKEARECGCGYVTQHRGAWCKHRKTCKHVAAQKHEERRDQEMEDLVKQQLATKDEQLAAKDAQLATKDEQLAAKDRQIEELLQANKVKKRAPPTRKTLSEPKRRRIAAAQNWKCANPDGMCLLKGDLEEYDVDHLRDHNNTLDATLDGPSDATRRYYKNSGSSACAGCGAFGERRARPTMLCGHTQAVNCLIP